MGPASMSPHTASALEQAAYNLRDEAKRSMNRAARLREEAAAYDQRAAGIREAADIMDAAVAEDAAS